MLRVPGGGGPAARSGRQGPRPAASGSAAEHEHRRARAEVRGVARRDGLAAVDRRQLARGRPCVVPGRGTSSTASATARPSRSLASTGTISSSKKPPARARRRSAPGCGRPTRPAPRARCRSAAASVDACTARATPEYGHETTSWSVRTTSPSRWPNRAVFEKYGTRLRFSTPAGDRDVHVAARRMLRLARLIAASDEQQARSTVYDDPVVGDRRRASCTWRAMERSLPGKLTPIATSSTRSASMLGAPQGAATATGAELGERQGPQRAAEPPEGRPRVARRRARVAPPLGPALDGWAPRRRRVACDRASERVRPTTRRAASPSIHRPRSARSLSGRASTRRRHRRTRSRPLAQDRACSVVIARP